MSYNFKFILAEEPQIHTILTINRVQRDENSIYIDDISPDDFYEYINPNSQTSSPSQSIFTNNPELLTESDYYDEEQIYFLAISRHSSLSNHFVVDIELPLNWTDQFLNRSSETFNSFKQNFKLYVETYNSNPKFEDSKILVNVQRVLKVYENDDVFVPNYILVTFLMETKNLKTLDEDLEFDENEKMRKLNIFKEIFDFFDASVLKEYLGDYEDDFELIDDDGIGEQIGEGESSEVEIEEGRYL